MRIKRHDFCDYFFIYFFIGECYYVFPIREMSTVLKYTTLKMGKRLEEFAMTDLTRKEREMGIEYASSLD